MDSATLDTGLYQINFEANLTRLCGLIIHANEQTLQTADFLETFLSLLREEDFEFDSDFQEWLKLNLRLSADNLKLMIELEEANINAGTQQIMDICASVMHDQFKIDSLEHKSYALDVARELEVIQQVYINSVQKVAGDFKKQTRDKIKTIEAVDHLQTIQDKLSQIKQTQQLLEKARISSHHQKLQYQNKSQTIKHHQTSEIQLEREAFNKWYSMMIESSIQSDARTDKLLHSVTVSMANLQPEVALAQMASFIIVEPIREAQTMKLIEDIQARFKSSMSDSRGKQSRLCSKALSHLDESLTYCKSAINFECEMKIKNMSLEKTQDQKKRQDTALTILNDQIGFYDMKETQTVVELLESEMQKGMSEAQRKVITDCLGSKKQDFDLKLARLVKFVAETESNQEKSKENVVRMKAIVQKGEGLLEDFEQLAGLAREELLENIELFDIEDSIQKFINECKAL